MKIGFATSSAYPDLTSDDQLALEFFKRSITVEPVIWDVPEVKWCDYDLVVVRSCWDYHLKFRAFLEWIELLKDKQIKVCNGPDILKWNCRKSYLLDLQNRGIPVIPSLIVAGDSKPKLEQILAEQSWQRVVIKPEVSADAWQTWTCNSRLAYQHQGRFEKMLTEHDNILLQPFIEEIKTQGEWSFIFIENQFSHAVLKKPKTGDFRVQEHLGGQRALKEPTDSLLKQVKNIYSRLNYDCLFARLDGIVIKDKFLVMEIELIEPSLFLKLDPLAPKRFAEAILSRIE